jgi:hypothetical protein
MARIGIGGRDARVKSFELELRRDAFDKLTRALEAVVARRHDIMARVRARAVLKAQRHLPHPFHSVNDFHLRIARRKPIDHGLNGHLRTRRPVNG